MDRIKPSTRLAFIAVAFLATLSVSEAARAGMVFAPPVEPDSSNYPASRFGVAPARVDLGVTAHYASREAEDLDDSGPAAPSRAPASLEYGQGTYRGPVKTARASAPDSGSASASNDESDPDAFHVNPLPKPDANPILRKGVQEIALIASDLGYFPKTLFVVRDLPVRLYVTGASKNTLCVMMDSFQVRKQVRAQKIEEITFTPNQPGKYRFYCPVNGMEGALIVKELTTAVATELRSGALLTTGN